MGQEKKASEKAPVSLGEVSAEIREVQRETASGRLLAELSSEERTHAYERFALLRPCLEEGVSLAEVARTHQMSLKNVQRWVQQYRREGLVGLARHRRSDRGKRRGLPPECVQLIEGLALHGPKRSVADIHRQVSALALQKGWPRLSYGRVYAIITAIDPQLVALAHEGSRVYQERYDLLFLQEVSKPNERWQADHCLLTIWLVNAQGKAARPYLTIILDEYSRAIVGYRLSFDAPSAAQTALTLRQAIWKKEDACWPMCGIPETFYTDHGCDFTSKHIEQVAAHLSMRLIFSQPGRPRGRGKIERLFRTIKQIMLPGLPGVMASVRQNYRSARKRRRQRSQRNEQSQRQAKLTLTQFDRLFRTWVLQTYHSRILRHIKEAPQARWRRGDWLPRLPESLNQLDLLLLREGTARVVHQEGLLFHGLRYMDTKLQGWVGKTVSVSYDPLDVATISIYGRDGAGAEQFLCQARCQEFADQKVSLKEIVTARNGQRKKLHGRLGERKKAVEQVGVARQMQESIPVSEMAPDKQSGKKKACGSQLVPPSFMARLAPEFLPAE